MAAAQGDGAEPLPRAGAGGAGRAAGRASICVRRSLRGPRSSSTEPKPLHLLRLHAPGGMMRQNRSSGS
eukprot:7134746-Prymnesium_polylepis.1